MITVDRLEQDEFETSTRRRPTGLLRAAYRGNRSAQRRWAITDSRIHDR